MTSIPEAYRDLFSRESFAHFATVMPDGTPQVTPVWIDYRDGYVLVNTESGRQKERNVARNPKVGLSILDPDDPYDYISIRGEVVEITDEGAADHIDELARRYMDVDRYPHHDEEDGERIILKIRPDRVVPRN